MRKFALALIISGCFAAVQAQNGPAMKTPADYVNPLMGTDSKPSLSNGNTYPAIGVPWGMNMWTAQTGKNGDGWQYTYEGEKIEGFKQTHQ
ncbi:MAG TPA: glycoside hydrolase family 92 protein, partial [Chitinophagaceae bacterium]